MGRGSRVGPGPCGGPVRPGARAGSAAGASFTSA